MKKRILCVEDDPDACQLVTSILKDDDYEITCAASLGEAIHKARAQKFDLYLVDYYLPDGLGLEFILSVNSNREIPTIIVTGAASLSEPQADRFGAYGLIKKNSPTFVDDLRDEVKQILAPADILCENV